MAGTSSPGSVASWSGVRMPQEMTVKCRVVNINRPLQPWIGFAPKSGIEARVVGLQVASAAGWVALVLEWLQLGTKQHHVMSGRHHTLKGWGMPRRGGCTIKVVGALRLQVGFKGGC